MRNYEHGGDVFAEDKKKIDFSVNINPLGMPDAAAKAAEKAVKEELSYPDPFCRKLTEALSERYGLPAENIVCGNGASDLILRLCAAKRPKKVLVPAPGFSEYARSAVLFGAEIFEYAACPDIKSGSLEGLLSLADAVELVKPDMVFVCRPNNPDGSLIGTEELCKAASSCEKAGAVLVIDECFLEFTKGTSALALMGRFRCIAVLNAFTKTYSMAGLRLGFMFSSDTALLDEVYRFGIPWSVSAPAQAAGRACCSEREFLSKSREYISKERNRLISAIRSFGLIVFKSDANFLLVRNDMESKKPLREELSDRGIKVRDCRTFTGLDDSYIRIGVRTEEENDALISALEDIYG